MRSLIEARPILAKVIKLDFTTNNRGLVNFLKSESVLYMPFLLSHMVSKDTPTLGDLSQQFFEE